MTSRLPRRRCCCWSARLFVTSIKVDARQSMWLERVVVVVEAPAAEAEIAWFLHSESTSAYRPPTSIFLALLPSSWFLKSRIINSTNLKKKEFYGVILWNSNPNLRVFSIFLHHFGYIIKTRKSTETYLFPILLKYSKKFNAQLVEKTYLY